jgi:hypothetical protein
MALAVALAFSLPLAGCVLHTHPRHGHSRSSVKRSCPPSHHWDGHQCRHNGKGHGARKHDHR